MELIYQGKNITDAVNIKTVEVQDNCGGIADTLEIVFSDSEGIWSTYEPRKGDEIEVSEDGYSSGIMYVDEIEQRRGLFILKAISLPFTSKTINTKAWENVRFLTVANEIAARHGLKLETYGVTDYLYSRLDQLAINDFEFLAYRCVLEGYSLKIADKKIIILNEPFIESLAAKITLDSNDFDGDFSFKSISNGLYSKSELIGNGNASILKSTFESNIQGPVLKNNMIVSNIAEADRYAKNLLRRVNKNEITGYIRIKFNHGITAGTNINIVNVGIFDDKYIVEKAVHRLTSDKSVLYLRKGLEGY